MARTLGILAAVVGIGVGALAWQVSKKPSVATAQANHAATSRSAIATEPTLRKAAEDAPEVSPLPSEKEVEALKTKVLAEHQRPPHASPDIVDNTAIAKPLRASRDAYKQGDYDTALTQAQTALALDPKHNQATMFAAMAACGLGDSRLAQAYVEKMDDKAKYRAGEKCKKLGVVLKNIPNVDPDE